MDTKLTSKEFIIIISASACLTDFDNSLPRRHSHGDFEGGDLHGKKAAAKVIEFNN